MAKKTKKGKTKTVVQVDIVSDIVCPWCWLGSRYLKQAIEKSGRTVEIRWRPYMLDPDVPEGGVPYKDYMKKKFGDAPNNRFTAMREMLETAAPDAGITFRFGETPMRPNTLDAHRVMKWAEGQGVSGKMSEALFKAFFDELKDIGDREVLADIAEEVGLERDVVADLLAGDNDKKTVAEEIAFFQRLGVSGVPCFIYNGQFAVQGAQPAEAHLAAIEKAANLPVQDDNS